VPTHEASSGVDSARTTRTDRDADALAAVTLRRSGWRWRVRFAALVGTWIATVVAVVAYRSMIDGAVIGWTAAVLPWLLFVQLLLLPSDPRSVTLSAEGIRWRGIGWSRRRSWSDFEAIGGVSPSPAMGAVFAQLRDGALGPSARRYPKRLTFTENRGSVRYAELLPLTQPTYGPRWDQPDRVVVELIRERVGDRWVDDLVLPVRGRSAGTGGES
jgi:hypothetical protein